MLTVEQLREAFAWYVRRFRRNTELNERAARAAIRSLESLAPSDRDMPAAVFFALASHPRTFPGATRAMTMLVTRATVATSSRVLNATDQELSELVFRVASRSIGFDDVRDWFAVRLSLR